MERRHKYMLYIISTLIYNKQNIPTKPSEIF